MSCLSPWTYEKKVGRGWTYNEPGLTYNSSEFDDLDVYYNGLALTTAWTEEVDAPVAAYSYEKRVAGGYLYNEPNLEYNAFEFDNFRVYYNRLGQETGWIYENAVAGGQEDFFLMMDGTEFLFQDGTQFQYNQLTTAPAAVYSYEKKVTGGYLYNEPGMTYNELMFDDMQVFYNSLGRRTDWFYDDVIDNCQPVPYLFMDGTAFTFQNGTPFDFN